MELVFPEPTPYEIYNYSNLANLAINIMNEMDAEKNDELNKQKDEIEKIKNELNSQIDFKSNIIIFLVVIEIITFCTFIGYLLYERAFGYKQISNEIELIQESVNNNSQTNIEMSKIN